MQFSYSENKYGRYCVPADTTHRPCAQRILRGEVHEPNTLYYIADIMQDGRYNHGHIVHGGTFFGDALPRLSYLVNNRHSVFAFEPNPTNYLATQLTIAINEFHGMRRNVSLHNVALGSKNGKTRIMTMENGVSLGGGSYIDENAPIEVQIVRLDSVIPYMSRRISIMYLDIERMEYEALLGAEKIIIYWHPVVIIEQGNHDADDYLLQHGYTHISNDEGNSFYEYIE